MKVEEIFVGPAREYPLSDKEDNFNDSESRATIRSVEGVLTLRSRKTESSTYYGLFDSRDKLIAYLELENIDNVYGQVLLSNVIIEYRGHGYGTLLYDFAVMNDNTLLLSDERQTPEAKKLWSNLRTEHKYPVVAFDMRTKEQAPEKTDAEVYNNEDLVWLAIPPGETINEALKRINNRRNGKAWEVIWYGPYVRNEY